MQVHAWIGYLFGQANMIYCWILAFFLGIGIWVRRFSRYRLLILLRNFGWVFDAQPVLLPESKIRRSDQMLKLQRFWDVGSPVTEYYWLIEPLVDCFKESPSDRPQNLNRHRNTQTIDRRRGTPFWMGCCCRASAQGIAFRQHGLIRL